MKNISIINGYHAHIYYDQDTIETAKALAQEAKDTHGIEIGRFHEKPVGPHPVWSCQLTVSATQFAGLLPWLSLNRKGLTMFVHPETDDAYLDHTEHAIWLGKQQSLSLDIFKN
jgi:aromatic ring-cleaving dioxygenase